MSASSVAAARPANRQGGATPTTALQQLGVQPIPIMIAWSPLSGAYFGVKSSFLRRRFWTLPRLDLKVILSFWA